MESAISPPDLNAKFEAMLQGFEELKRLFRETDAKFNETDQRIEKKTKESDKKYNKAYELFTSKWGKLVESLVNGDLVPILNARGIPVSQTICRMRGHHAGTSFEFDILAINGSEMVVVEVKTTLRPDDVMDFLEKLAKFKTWAPAYANQSIYGAVAFLQADSGAEIKAEKNGLFAIRATGNSASLINAPDFKPRLF